MSKMREATPEILRRLLDGHRPRDIEEWGVAEYGVADRTVRDWIKRARRKIPSGEGPQLLPIYEGYKQFKGPPGNPFADMRYLQEVLLVSFQEVLEDPRIPPADRREEMRSIAKVAASLTTQSEYHQIDKQLREERKDIAAMEPDKELEDVSDIETRTFRAKATRTKR